MSGRYICPYCEIEGSQSTHARSRGDCPRHLALRSTSGIAIVGVGNILRVAFLFVNALSARLSVPGRRQVAARQRSSGFAAGSLTRFYIASTRSGNPSTNDGEKEERRAPRVRRPAEQTPDWPTIRSSTRGGNQECKGGVEAWQGKKILGSLRTGFRIPSARFNDQAVNFQLGREASGSHGFMLCTSRRRRPGRHCERFYTYSGT